jgi:hypothetical protein
MRPVPDLAAGESRGALPDVPDSRATAPEGRFKGCELDR